MVLFGPAGASDEIREQKLNLPQMVEYLYNKGLTTYEYPLTYGTNITDESAKAIGAEFKKYNISLSVHAPYYINFASPEPDNIQKSIGYLMNSVYKAQLMGADRVVFHPGSLTKQTREQALANCLSSLKLVSEILTKENINIFICPETMGKHGQIGTWQEVLEMCKLDKRFIPTLDFGHINSFLQGALKTKEDFLQILDAYINAGKNDLHIHFSKIEYGLKGELKHLTFEGDNVFGPDYKPFLDALQNYKDKNIRVVSESAGTQTIDSKTMQDYFKKLF